MNEKKSLAPEKVLNIRNQLNRSQESMASLIDVSPSAVKGWESGDRKCNGPTRLLLLLLERDPAILDWLDTSESTPQSLPNPNAPKGTTEWFRMQRLLFLIGRSCMTAYLHDIYEEEGMNDTWLEELYYAGLLEPCPKNSFYRATGKAEREYRHTAWIRWKRARGYDHDRFNTLDLPIMTSEDLKEFDLEAKERQERQQQAR